jgi:hypothetical protein
MQALNLQQENTPVKYAFSFLGTKLTQCQYVMNLSKLFKFLQLEGSTIEEQGLLFLDKARDNPNWPQECIMSCHF